MFQGESLPDGSNAGDGESPISSRNENSSEPVTPASTSQYNRPRPPKRRPESLSDQAALTKEVLLSVNKYFKRPAHEDDRFDIFGKHVAMKLRELAKQ